MTTPALLVSELFLGLGDTFEVCVFGEKDLIGEYCVGVNGMIDYLLIGCV